MSRSKQRPPTPRDTLSVVGPSLRKVHHLSRADARRIAVRAQLLTADRPTDVHETVRALTFLQLNPTSAIAPSADLVLWSRLGSSYDPQELADALDEQTIIEFRGMLRVAEDLALYRAEMAVWPGTGDAGEGLAARQPAVGRGQRGLPPGHPGAAARRRSAADQRAPRHLRAAVEVLRLEQQPQRHHAARPHGADGRRRTRRGHRPRPALGPGRARLPAGPAGAAGGGVPDPRRAQARGARHRAAEGARAAGGAAGRPGRGGARRHRGRPRRVARRPRAAGPAVRGARGAALPARPAPVRPQAHDGRLRVRLHPRDVQAGRPRGAGATSRSRCWSATGWWASSTPPRT